MDTKVLFPPTFRGPRQVAVQFLRQRFIVLRIVVAASPCRSHVFIKPDQRPTLLPFLQEHRFLDQDVIVLNTPVKPNVGCDFFVVLGLRRSFSEQPMGYASLRDGGSDIGTPPVTDGTVNVTS